MSISWKDVLHYGSALVLYLIGLIGASGVHLPGVTIDPATCFITASGILAAGLKGGLLSGANAAPASTNVTPLKK